MRYLRVFELSLIFSLLFLSGCAFLGGSGEDKVVYDPPVRGEEPKNHIDDVLFKFDENGNLVTVTPDGRPYLPCAQLGKNKCRIFRDKIHLTKLKMTTIIQLQYDVNPTECRYIKTMQNGVEQELIHPADRHKDC